MVLYFQSNADETPVLLYMGKDKFENEDLIKHGWDNDVWFHVDKLSSAHVYLRLPDGENSYTWEDIPQNILIDCAQLTKANSIEGNKKNNITVIYTPWSNLKKTGAMETGQVTFHNMKLVKRVHVEERRNEIVNRLNKTKIEEYPDLALEKIKRDKELRSIARAIEKAKMLEEMKIQEEARKGLSGTSYADIMNDTEMKSNKQLQEEGFDVEDDFM
ncbi:Coiled-coil domain-containing protein 25 [Nowakowskiella sp. JEL0407]|nr:Coiled-coil domain-containing protein 25 [Nowakowskiella sp. JEL0407]